MQESNKRILKNAQYLYVRMFITMWLTLYMSRMLLQVLGVRDYGVLTVVGGIGGFFSFANSSFVMASERFIASAIAIGDKDQLKKVFTACVNSHLLLALVIAIGYATFGYWFLTHRLVIPSERMFAAHIVFLVSVVGSMIEITTSPFHACIIAYERMSFHALLGILSTCWKLLVIIGMYTIEGDGLVIYTLIGLCGSLFFPLISIVYCKLKLPDIVYLWQWDNRQLKKVMAFNVWNLLKQASYVGFRQGTNFIFNIYGGVVVNAAYGIANHVHSSCLAFMHGVQSAFYPQIIKTCAAHDYSKLHLLIKRSAKYSNYMLMVVAVPIMLSMETVLELWLGNVPLFTKGLAIVMLLSCFIESFTEPLNTALLATGKVKAYQMITACIWIASILFLYLAVVLRFEFYQALIVRLFAQIAIFLLCSFFLKRFIEFPYNSFFKQECASNVAILGCSLSVPFCLSHILDLPGTLIPLLFNTSMSLLIIIVCIYFWGLKAAEREFVRSVFRKIPHKIWK